MKVVPGTLGVYTIMLGERTLETHDERAVALKHAEVTSVIDYPYSLITVYDVDGKTENR